MLVFVRRFTAVRAESSYFMALRLFHRLCVFPTTTCKMKASKGRFVATRPPRPLAIAATADSRACMNPQPPAPTAGELMKARVEQCDATVPPVSVATAGSVACSKVDPQTPAPPTVGGPPTNNGRQPCNRTRQELDAIMKDIKKGEVDYSDYIFNVASNKRGWEKRKLQYNLSDDDDMDRCKVCGLKISEHRAAADSGPSRRAADSGGTVRMARNAASEHA